MSDNPDAQPKRPFPVLPTYKIHLILSEGWPNGSK